MEKVLYCVLAKHMLSVCGCFLVVVREDCSMLSEWSKLGSTLQIFFFEYIQENVKPHRL